MAKNNFLVAPLNWAPCVFAKDQPVVSADKTSVVSADTTDVLSADTTGWSFAKTQGAQFKGATKKLFLAITCTSWLRLNFWRRGLARNFSAHLFGCYAPALILGQQVQFWDLQVNNFAWGPFWAKFGVPQNIRLL